MKKNQKYPIITPLHSPSYLKRGLGGVNDNRLGFTLVEILVVITIIGLLSTIGLTGFQAVTRSGRDALRKTDLEQLRSALEIYKSEENNYPADSGSCSANAGGDFVPAYINPYPFDPKSPTYDYCYKSLGGLTYQLCAHLENGGTTNLCPGEECGSGEICNYRVTNP